MGIHRRKGSIAGFIFIGLAFGCAIVIFHSRLDSSNPDLTRDRRETYQWELLGPSSPECPIFKSCSSSGIVTTNCQFQTDCTPLNQFCCPSMNGSFCCQNQAPTPFPVVPIVGTVTAFTGSTTVSPSTITGLTGTTNNFTTTPFTGPTSLSTGTETIGTGTSTLGTGTTNTGSTASIGTGTTPTGTTQTGTTQTGQTTTATGAATTTRPTTPAAG